MSVGNGYLVALGIVIVAYASLQGMLGIKDFREGDRTEDAWPLPFQPNSGFKSRGIFWFSIVWKLAIGLIAFAVGLWVL